MDFAGAMKELIVGKHVRRKEWADKGIYLSLVDEKIQIFNPDKKYHPLIVSLGDLVGDDWVVC